jgi:hypothetical protein
MRVLAELQKDFQQYLMSDNTAIQTEIISTEKVSASARLDVYRNAYFARLLEVFHLDYPALHTLLGDDEFRLLTRRYIDANPSQYRSIRWFGNNLAAFLEERAPYGDNRILAEMARFEWLLTEAFDAPDDAVMSLEEMAMIPFDKWPAMSFRMHTAVRKVDFIWNITQLWKVAEANEALYPEQHAQPISYLIWRKNYEVQFASLSPDEAYMLDAMIAGTSFGEICEGLCEWLEPEEVAMHAASLLKRYIIDGTVSQVLY